MPTVGMGRVPATLGRQFGKMRRPASLGAKLVLIMTGVALCGTVAITVLLASIITPSFTKLEDAAIAGQVERTRAMLTRYAAEVQAEARDRRDVPKLSGARLAPNSRAAPVTRLLPADGLAEIAVDGRIALAEWSGSSGSSLRGRGYRCSIVPTSHACLAIGARLGSMRGWGIVSQR
ncbi:hypothetical protein QP150_06805 [Sphingomonas sp. 22L2VL55-3]